MDLNLKNKVALVTGSTRGLGKTIALTLAKEGSSVIINGRKEPDTKRVAREISVKLGVPTYECPVDVTDHQAIKKFFSEAMPKIGRLDILINNAGNLEKSGTLFDLEDSDWLRQLQLSYLSIVRFSLCAYPWLKRSGCGRIINISSIPAHQPGQSNPHYAGAKGAILPVSKMMANEFAKDNILVNVICPATLEGGGWHENILRRAKRRTITPQEAEAQMKEEEKGRTPLGRMGQLEDVAYQVAFLASDKANFITGQCFNIDGGLTRSIL